MSFTILNINLPYWRANVSENDISLQNSLQQSANNSTALIHEDSIMADSNEEEETVSNGQIVPLDSEEVSLYANG